MLIEKSLFLPQKCGPCATVIDLLPALLTYVYYHKVNLIDWVYLCIVNMSDWILIIIIIIIANQTKSIWPKFKGCVVVVHERGRCCHQLIEKAVSYDRKGRAN